jgi:hypothetical protein
MGAALAVAHQAPSEAQPALIAVARQTFIDGLSAGSMVCAIAVLIGAAFVAVALRE